VLKVLCILGTRPEAIKLAPVIRELRRQEERIDTRVCVTGQHREMVDDVLQLFQLVPDHDLNLMQANQSLAYLTGQVLTEADRILGQERPDWLLVQGDTTTVAAASLSAYYQRVKVGHVEAGLRTRDIHNPFPEEVNRHIADLVATLRFAPTARARENLLDEGLPACSIMVTGNTVIDALRTIVAQPFDAKGTLLAELAGPGKRVVLLTVHRRESFGQPLRSIFAAVAALADRYLDQVEFVYPVHPNPNVRGLAHEMLAGRPNVHLTGPLNYELFIRLMQRAYLILTDSGGLQEEAPAFGVPTLILRDTTERPEAVDAGTARLVGRKTEEIVRAATDLLESAEAHARMACAANPFGDGQASGRIVSALLQWPADVGG
jgi:UDP-N-acetylglucosamine 2-epimerase (non-hydrolysing)